MAKTFTQIPSLRKTVAAAAAIILAGGAVQAQYCIPSFNVGCTDFDDIHTFTLDGANSTSIVDSNTGCSANAYHNATTLTAQLQQGGVYTAYVNSEYSDEGVQVYIDFNNDGTFSASETVGGVNNVDDIGTTFSLYIPAGVTLGSRRMRVVLSYDFQYPSISACPTTQYYDYGEVHDYSVSIIAGSGGPACTAPVAASASAMTSTGAQLWWSTVAGAQGYESLIDQNSNAPTTSGTPTTSNTYTATGLSAGQQYFLHARAKCGATTFSPWITRPFVTESVGATCSAPGGLQATVSGTQATVSWSAVPGSLGYEIFLTDVPNLYPLNGTPWTATSATYTGLDPYTPYYLYLRHECSNSTVSDWAVLTLTTGMLGSTQSISGNLYSDAYPYPSADTYKVWLIRYDSLATSLTAVDSITTDAGAYSFTGMTPGAYYVKAAQITVLPVIGGLGQVPTYHDSSLYWNTALVQSVAAGASLPNRHIWMRQGTVTTGPGFIGGNVSLGANKGAAAGVSNLLVLLRNASGRLVKAVYTDGAGNFSFGSLPVGTYSVYPEKMNYTTTPAASIVVSASQPSRTGIDFNQDDAKKSIKQRPTSVANIAATIQCGIHPNPAIGSANLRWTRLSGGDVRITITAASGGVVLDKTVPAANGDALLDLRGMQSGIYFVRLQSDAGSSVQKLIVAP